MITQLSLRNFKSWKNITNIPVSAITGFFGTNSSGKTSILQFIMMLKQTAESRDQERVLHTGDKNSYVDLGTFYDFIHNHRVPGKIQFAIEWTLKQPISISSFTSTQPHLGEVLFKDRLKLEINLGVNSDNIWVEQFSYSSGDYRLGMKRRSKDKEHYDLFAENFTLVSMFGMDYTQPQPPPIKSYEFFQPARFYLFGFATAFEEMMAEVYYLGPLRDYPSRTYIWSGERPQDVGTRGENTIPALLAASVDTQEQIATWLQKIGLIHGLKIHAITPNRRDYEVLVQSSPNSSWVPITDVGFGISQILPVLVLCYHVPEESTVILEQPEIHLHPAVQAGLADIFIDVMQNRRLQIILESHSEHLLRRLQRRVAEARLPSQDVALYFTSIDKGVSRLTELDLDELGNIRNWPESFFGDELGDLTAMTEAAMRRDLRQSDT